VLEHSNLLVHEFWRWGTNFWCCGACPSGLSAGYGPARIQQSTINIFQNAHLKSKHALPSFKLLKTHPIIKQNLGLYMYIVLHTGFTAATPIICIDCADHFSQYPTLIRIFFTEFGRITPRPNSAKGSVKRRLRIK